MSISNAEITKSVRDTLSGNWGIAVGVYLVVYVILLLTGNVPVFGWIAGLLLTGPFSLGLSVFSLNLLRGTGAEFGQVWEGFNRFKVSMLAYVWIVFYSFLWALFLIIPGIIVYLSYKMTFYILVDFPDISECEAIHQSKEMMEGNKWKLFKLYCRFIGWAILCVLTMGVGFIWLMPYVGVSVARFYEDIK